MEITIDKMLKQLRKEKGNTQEDLAKYLGISYQAVSKWECGDGLPDITLLPKIAAYYCVSVDTILGVDEAAKARRIDEISAEYQRIRYCEPNPDGTLIVDHGIDEGIVLIREAVKELPDCWFFMQLLASDLWWKGKSAPVSEREVLFEEAEELCLGILNRCIEDRWRHCATSILCMVYNDSGRKEMALDIAWRSPCAVDSQEWKLSKVMEGDELIDQLRRNIREFLRLLYLNTVQMSESGGSFDFAKSDDTMKLQLETICSAVLEF